MKYVITLLLMTYCLDSIAMGKDIHIGTPLISKHTNSPCAQEGGGAKLSNSYVRGMCEEHGGYNETHPGLYLRSSLTESSYAEIGTYENSYYKTTNYVGLGVEDHMFDSGYVSAKMGMAVYAATGYEETWMESRVTPVLAITATLEVGSLGFRNTLIPTGRHDVVWGLAIEYNLK